MRTSLPITLTLGVVMCAAGAIDAQTININGNSDQVWHGTQAGAKAGQYLDIGAVSGGDNRADLIIGAPGSPGLPGSVYVIFGGQVRSGDLSLANADTVIAGGAAGDQFGASTAAGNVITPETSLTRNLVVGAPGALGGRGAVYVYAAGFATGAHLTTADANYTILGAPGDQLGAAIATADLDGDGFREIIIGAPGNNRVYIIKGSSTLSGTRDLSTSPAVGGASGLTIAGPGLGEVIAAADVTGDGIADLLIGSADYASGTGIVYFYKGRSGSIPTTPDGAFGGAHVGDRAGTSIRLLDIDHDGVKDIIIGAPGVDGPAGDRTDSGAVYLIWGGPNLASRTLSQSDVTFFGGAATMQLGAQISAGDINRDLPSDIVMLAPGGAANGGELDIYYGRTDRTTYGVDAGNGLRVVDFADQTQIDRKIIGDATLGPLVSTAVFEVTGEGARDVIASIPSQDSSTGAVYFAISPALNLDHNTINVVVNKGATVPSSTITISNPSVISITWSATSNQPWLTPNPGSGSTVLGTPGTLGATINASALQPGTYSATMTVASTSKHLDEALPVTVSLTVADTVISIDVPGNGATLKEPFTIAGWAIDVSSSTGTGVDQVQLYAARNDGSGASAIFLGLANYGINRSDVGAIYGSRFTPSGWQAAVAGLPAGPYHLYAYARNAATGAITAVAGRDVTVQTSGLIWIDTPAVNGVMTSAFEVGGWAIDPDSTTGTGIDAVQFWVFPNGGLGSPVFLGTGSYGWNRADVASMFGSRFGPSGYHITVTGMMPGNYVLGVYAHSTVTNAYSDIKTIPFSVSATALMSIDAPAPESTISTASFNVGGWAIDRSATSGTGIDQAHVYAYPNPGSGQPAIFLGMATLGVARSDVAALYGAQFTNSGYNFTVNRAAMGLAPGVYNIVVWTHSSVSGTFITNALVRVQLQ